MFLGAICKINKTKLEWEIIAYVIAILKFDRNVIPRLEYNQTESHRIYFQVHLNISHKISERIIETTKIQFCYGEIGRVETDSTAQMEIVSTRRLRRC